MRTVLVWKCRRCAGFERETLHGERTPWIELEIRIRAPSKAARIGIHECRDVPGGYGLTDLIGADVEIGAS